MSGTWALFVGLGLLMVGNGLNGAVIGVRSSEEGFGVVVAGVVMAGYFAGFLLSPSFVVRYIPAVGHIRVFAGLASMASTAVLMHSVWINPVNWAAMRFVFGFCAAGLYIVIESWLGDVTDTSTRGRTMAVYMIVSMGGLGVGQYLISLSDPSGFHLFVLSSVLVSMSLVPMTLAATTRAPELSTPAPIRIREMLDYVPSGIIGTFLSGASAGIVLGLAPVYASTVGYSVDRTAFFLVAPTIGAIVLQWPIGWISDRVSRRSVIFVVAALAGSVSLFLAFLGVDNSLVPIAMLVLGGLMFPFYSLVISFSLDWTPDGKTVGASSTLVRVNGMGALVGPLVAAPLMAQFGQRWFFFSITIAFAAVVAYLCWRIAIAEAMPVADQGDFIPVPARSSVFAATLGEDPEDEALDDDQVNRRPIRRVRRRAVRFEP